MCAATRTAASDSYMELITAFPLRRIKTVADHFKAKEIVLRQSSARADRGRAEYLDVLIDLIADYEKRFAASMDLDSLTAADLVRHRIEERGSSMSALARDIGVPQSNLSEMLSGKRDWSKTAIRGLSGHLNIAAERFLGN